MDALWNLLNADALASLPLGWALLGLFALALAAATLLPLGSEAAVLALAHAHGGGISASTALIWLAATLGNTAGGLVTYGMGRAARRAAEGWRSNVDWGTRHVSRTRDIRHTDHASRAADPSATIRQGKPCTTDAPELPRARPARGSRLARAWVQRHGALALLLSWLPLVGDALCAAAGWLRLSAGSSALCMALGKGARYAALLCLLS